MVKLPPIDSSKLVRSKLKLLDLSQPIYHGCPHCSADPAVVSERVADHPKEGWRVEKLTLTSHTGSHIDAPLHKLQDAPSIDSFPLERFVGQAYLIDYRSSRPEQPFTSTSLTRVVRNLIDLADKIILLATGWGDKREPGDAWEKEAPYLSPDGAGWLVEQEVRGVGIDACSIGGVKEPTNTLTHQRLLEANIWIMEDLRFPPEAFALPQPFQFWGLPIHLKGHGGAFCRPVAVVET